MQTLLQTTSDRAGRIHRQIAGATLSALLVLGVSSRAQDIDPLSFFLPVEPPATPVTGFHIETPGAMQVPTCSSEGARVFFRTPFATTECSAGASVTCEPPSGSVFPIGQNLIRCLAVTACGDRAAESFPVNVLQDKAPPRIECPSDQVVYSTDGRGAVVDYRLATAADDADPSPRVDCTPGPGTVFPMGRTVVECVATDACDQRAACSFVVEVKSAELRMRLVRDTPAAGPTFDVTSVGLAGLDYCDGLDGEWLPAESAQIRSLTVQSPTRFYRPPILDGVLRSPLGEIGYVSVGLLRAYDNPGIELKRTTDDASTSGGLTLLAGDSWGSGNHWSKVWSLPFTFHFFGRPYKDFRVSKNGLLTFSTNIVTGLEGLDYFNFPLGTSRLTNGLPLWNAGFNVDNTIFCMAGRHLPQENTEDVTSFIYGQAPHRQAWILYRHRKDVYGMTATAIVLEEGSNRIYLMDMDVETPSNATSRLLAGIQGQAGSTREVCRVPASPYMALVANDKSCLDNGCYLFRPYIVGSSISGYGSPKLLAATNLDLFVSETMRQANLPGATVAVSSNGRLIYNKGAGFANVEKGIKMKPYHRACIGSVSKVLTALGVEKLVEQGKIPNLDTWAYRPDLLGKSWFWAGVKEAVDNGTYFSPGTAVTLNTISNITLRHLLSHTSSYNKVNDDLGAANAYAGGSYSNLTAQQQVRWFMASQPPLTDAVAKMWSYSNPAFKQLGVLVEEVAGEPFEEWMKKNLLEPAGVYNMRLLRTYEFQETWRDARRYDFYSTNLPWSPNRFTGVVGPRPYNNYRYDNAADGGAGSWTATAEDLCRLMAAVDGLPNHPDIMDPARSDELETVAFPMVSGTQAHGWDWLSGFGRVQKGGAIGFGASILTRWIGPSRLTVAVVCNSQTGATALADGLYSAVASVNDIEPGYDLFVTRAYVTDINPDNP